VRIETNSDLTVSEISAASVDLDAKTGSILDDLDDITAIRANNISLTSNGSIGSSSVIGDMDAGYLDIALGGGSLSLSSKGNIYINEIASANFLTSQVTNVNTGVKAHDVFLVNSAGDITVDSAISAEDNILLAANNLNVNADISTTADDIDLIALDNVKLAGDISSSDYIGIQADFYSAYLNEGGDGTGAITQSAGIVGSGSEDLELSAGSGIVLDTAVSTLEAENTTSGNIDINNTGDLVIVDSGVNNQGGEIDISVASNLSVASDSKIVTNGGDINLSADGDIYVNNISTDGTFTGSTPPSSGTVTITAGGNIEDNYDQNSNPDDIYDINADDIVLSAGGDIGSGSKAPIELRSNGLSIIKGNDVSLFHKGNLDFGGFSGESFSLTNAGDLTISGDITTSGDINLSVVEDPNLTINATLDSGGGDVSLSATRHILLDNFALIMTRGGNFTAQADSNNNYIGTYTMNPGSEVDTASGAATPGSVLISADDAEIYGTVFSGSGDITVAPNLDQSIGLGGGIGAFRLSDDELDNLMTTGLLTIGSSSAGDISIDDITQPGKNIALITGGKIQEQGVDFGTEIVAQSLSLQAVSGIGSGNALETEVQNLSVYNSASGNIEINNSGLLNITEVAGVAGVVNQGLGSIIIRTRRSNANINIYKPIVGRKRVSLISAGRIDDHHSSGPADITAGELELRTKNGIGTESYWGIEVDTDKLAAYTEKGDVWIGSFGPVTIDKVGNTVGVVNEKGDINLKTYGTNADLTIARPIQALGSKSRVTLDVAGALIDGYYGRDITASSLELRLVNGMGFTSPAVNNYLETKVKKVAAYNSDSGDIKINNKGDLTVGSVGSTTGITNEASGGDVIVRVHSNLTLNAPTTTTGGNVTYAADGSITHNADGDISTNSGNYKGNADSDGNGTGRYLIKKGATIYTGGPGNTWGNSWIIAGKWNGSDPASLAGGQDIIINGNPGIKVINPGNANSYIMTGGGNIRGNAYVATQGVNCLLYAPQGSIGKASAPLNIKVVNLAAQAGNLINLYERTHLDVRTVLGIEGILAGGDIELVVGDPDYLTGGSIGGYGNSLNLYLTNKIESTKPGGIIDISVPYGGIYDNNDAALDIIASDLTMLARDAIGTSAYQGRIDTQVDNLWAMTLAGDIWVNELDGINLWDIQVLGSRVDIISGGDTYAYYILAEGTGAGDDAVVNLKVNGGSLFVNGIIKALLTGNGQALITAQADNDVDVSASEITASVSGSGISKVEMNAGTDITVANSDLLSQVDNNGSAEINLTADGNITIDPSTITAQVLGDGDSSIDITAGADLTITDSDLLSKVKGDGSAEINLTAGGNITIDPSTITAQVLGLSLGDVEVGISAEGDIDISNSLIKAWTERMLGIGYVAELGIESNKGDINVESSTLKAGVEESGNAAIDMNTYSSTGGKGKINITNSNIISSVGKKGEAEIDIEAQGSLSIDPSVIRASVGKSGIANIQLKSNGAGGNVVIDSSCITAQASKGIAEVYIISTKGKIKVSHSRIKSQASGKNSAALVNLEAYKNIKLKKSEVKAKVSGKNSKATVNFIAKRDIKFKESKIKAQASARECQANIYANAGRDININNSKIKAQGFGALSYANIGMEAQRNFSIKNSLLKAEVKSGSAQVGILGSRIFIDPSLIVASVYGDGRAEVSLSALGSINIADSNIFAHVGRDGQAAIGIDAKGKISIADSRIKARVDDYFIPANLASVVLTAGNNIEINRSVLKAENLDGAASLELSAGSNIRLTDTLIKAFSRGCCGGGTRRSLG